MFGLSTFGDLIFADMGLGAAVEDGWIDAPANKPNYSRSRKDMWLRIPKECVKQINSWDSESHAWDDGLGSWQSRDIVAVQNIEKQLPNWTVIK